MGKETNSTHTEHVRTALDNFVSSSCLKRYWLTLAHFGSLWRISWFNACMTRLKNTMADGNGMEVDRHDIVVVMYLDLIFFILFMMLSLIFLIWLTLAHFGSDLLAHFGSLWLISWFIACMTRLKNTMADGNGMEVNRHDIVVVMYLELIFFILFMMLRGFS